MRRLNYHIFTQLGRQRVCLTSCRFTKDTWQSAGKLSVARAYSSSIPIDATTMMVIGGEGGESAVDFMKINGEEDSRPGQDMPFRQYGGCAVKINSTTALTIGGFIDGSYSGKTYFYSIERCVKTCPPTTKWVCAWGHNCCRALRVYLLLMFKSSICSPPF